MLDPILTTRW